MNIRDYSSITALLGLLACLNAANAAEFDDTDILPRVSKLVFTDDNIGVYVKPSFLRFIDQTGYILDRKNLKALAASDEAFNDLVAPLRLSDHKQPDSTEWKAYRHLAPKCQVVDGIARLSLNVDGESIEVIVRECFNVSSTVITDEYIAIGTFVDGDHGRYGAVGVLWISRCSGKLIDALDTGPYAVNRLYYDNFSDQVWAVTNEQISVISADGTVASRLKFYFSFEEDSGAPVVKLSNERKRSNPIAVIAALLSPSQHRAFYRDFQSAGAPMVSRVFLRDFFTCCHFYPGANQLIDDDLDFLIPYLVEGAKFDALNYGDIAQGARIWRQLACRFTGRRDAELLCSSENWSEFGLAVDRNTKSDVP